MAPHYLSTAAAVLSGKKAPLKCCCDDFFADLEQELTVAVMAGDPIVFITALNNPIRDPQIMKFSKDMVLWR